jgi:hypothetical protein
LSGQADSIPLDIHRGSRCHDSDIGAWRIPTPAATITSPLSELIQQITASPGDGFHVGTVNRVHECKSASLKAVTG